jgi:4-amino-4-deoxy-L-arabinose transferase-like glycosyltransferase
MDRKALILLIPALLLLFVGTFDHSLWTPDEPRVAEISRVMAASGDYLIPELSGRPFLEQPPLYYAVAGVFWHIFGTGNEGFGRLASVLFAAGTLLIVFFGTKALYSAHAAALSALVLATTGDYFLMTHKMVVDNALVFFITAALFCFVLAYRGVLGKGYVLFWICLAGAFLTKGIIGIAIPGAGAAIFILWQKDPAMIKKAWVVPGILLVVMAMLAWAWGLYLRGGKDFLSTFFLYNNLGRFASQGIYRGGHINPFYYYLYTVLLNGLPWSIALIAALIAGWKPDERLRFFCSWFFGGLVLLSIASTKRGLYFLPMYPAMAVIAGQWLSGMANREPATWEKIVLRGLLAVLVVLAMAVPAGYVKIGGSLPAAVAVFFVAAGLFLAYRTAARSLPEWLPAGFAVLFLSWSTPLFLQVDTLKTYEPFFRQAGRIVGQEKVIGYNLTETVEAFSPFYGGFPVNSIEDKKRYEQMVLSRSFRYVLVERPDPELMKIIGPRGEKLLATTGRERKELQLWRLSR